MIVLCKINAVNSRELPPRKCSLTDKMREDFRFVSQLFCLRIKFGILRSLSPSLLSLVTDFVL